MVDEHSPSRWTVAALPWSQLQPAAIDDDLLATDKTAALVEANSADYVRYLHNIFADDAEFQRAASMWGEEEAQHGEGVTFFGIGMAFFRASDPIDSFGTCGGGAQRL